MIIKGQKNEEKIKLNDKDIISLVKFLVKLEDQGIIYLVKTGGNTYEALLKESVINHGVQLSLF